MSAQNLLRRYATTIAATEPGIAFDICLLADVCDKTAGANKKFDAYIALAADDIEHLRKSDVFRVLSEAKSAKELTALAAYITKGNSSLASAVTEDTPDVADEKNFKL